MCKIFSSVSNAQISSSSGQEYLEQQLHGILEPPDIAVAYLNEDG